MVEVKRALAAADGDHQTLFVKAYPAAAVEAQGRDDQVPDAPLPVPVSQLMRFY